jgi:hypothetical protein
MFNPDKKVDQGPDSEVTKEFLDRLFWKERAIRTWKSLNLFYTNQSPLPGDRIQFNDKNEIFLSTQTKPTNVGLGMAAILGAEMANIIEVDEADQRLEQMLKALSKVERINGFFVDWYDSQSSDILTHWPTDNHQLDVLLSSVDNAWLAVVLLILKKAKPNFAQLIDEEFLNKMNFEDFFDHEAQELFGGYSVTNSKYFGHYPRNLVSETRIVHWVNAALTQDKQKRVEILKRLLDKEGKIPDKSAGGAMFEIFMPTHFVKEDYLHDVIQKLFQQHLDYGEKSMDGLIGISVADNPSTGQYIESGVGGAYKPLGFLSSHGMLEPLSLDKTSVLKTIDRMEKIQGFYGEFGYMDGVNPTTQEITHSQVFINQVMVFLSLIQYPNNQFSKLFSQYFDDETKLAFD